LVRKPEENRPLGRPRRRWQDNIRLALGEIGCEVVVWIHLAQKRNQWRCNVPSGSTKGGKFLG